MTIWQFITNLFTDDDFMIEVYDLTTEKSVYIGKAINVSIPTNKWADAEVLSIDPPAAGKLTINVEL